MRRSFEYVIKNSNPKIIAEVGVAAGDNAYDMLVNHELDYILLVDNYLTYYDAPTNSTITQEQQTIKCMQALLKLMPRKYFNKINFSFLPSQEIVKYIPNNFFDYVYIDGHHEYDDVKRDVELWLPKVKESGFLGGHDFGEDYPGVKKAVKEFIANNDYKLRFVLDDGLDWLVQKCIKS